MNPKEIHIEDYDYPLPEERIAKFPLEERDSSKLLVYENGVFSDDRFSNIAGDLHKPYSFALISAGNDPVNYIIPYFYCFVIPFCFESINFSLRFFRRPFFKHPRASS